MRPGAFLLAIVLLGLVAVDARPKPRNQRKSNSGCSNSGVIGEGFQCFQGRNNEARFQEDAYPAPEQRYRDDRLSKIYKERPDSRQSKKIKNDYNNRKDLNLGGAGNNPRNYKHKKQQAKKKGYHGKGRGPHAKMKKNWKTSSSVSGDKYKNSGVGNYRKEL